MTHAQLVEVFRPFINPGELVFDVGAWIGDYTKAFTDLGANVVAFEPQNIHFPCYERRREALAANCGKAMMYRCGHSSMSTLSGPFKTISERNGDLWDTTRLSVDTETLDRMISQYGVPSFIKIDVEGYEYEVLSGLSQPIKALSFEYNTQPGLWEIAQQAVYRLCALGDYEMNFLPEGDHTLPEPWVAGPILPATIRLWHLDREWFGDIFARRVE